MKSAEPIKSFRIDEKGLQVDIFMDWLEGKRLELQSSGRLKLSYAGLAILGILVACLGSLVKIEFARVILGGFAGTMFFTSLCLLLVDLPSSLQDKLDLRGNWIPSKRRWLAGWAVLVWIVILQGLQNLLPSTIVGSLNVLVSLIIWRLVVLTPLERSLDIAQNNIESEWPIEEMEEE